jgi:hypothetical protein
MSPITLEQAESIALRCDFCGRTFQPDEAFYESRAYRVFEEGAIDECGNDSAILSCESCEVIRMRVARWLRWVPFLFPKAKS